MKYLCLVYPAEDFALTQEVTRQFYAFRKDATAAGVYGGAGRLEPADTATTVRVRDGEAMLTDGPFAEIKEAVGGYVLLDCADLDEVVGWVARLPGAQDGAVEIRPLMELPG